MSFTPKEVEIIIQAYQDYTNELKDVLEEHMNDLSKIMEVDPDTLTDSEKAIIYPLVRTWHNTKHKSIKIQSNYTQKLYELLIETITEVENTE